MENVVKLKTLSGAASDLGIPLQSASVDIWDSKYRLKAKDGTVLDNTVDDTWQRVASAIAEVEPENIRAHWRDRFLWALRAGAIPAGRIMSNAGAGEHKFATSTINCTVSNTIRDSMESIMDSVKEAGLTLRAGSGIGYEFSTLRPHGALVAGAGASTSGPLSFMDIFDRTCATIASAGGRRGAQMATFDIGHPDVLDFIDAKREDGRLRQFNLSLLVTDEFLKAVKENGTWKLVFPYHRSEIERGDVNLDDPEKTVWRRWSVTERYKTNGVGLVACKVYKTIKARELWDRIMSSTYNYSEPGFILIDRANEMNNNWWCENIRASNPCAEQFLPPSGACLLGSVNLTRFVREPFTVNANFDWDSFREVVRVFTRMLDDVVEINGLPLASQQKEILHKRRHGMGFLGLGSTLAMLCVPYGSRKAVSFTEAVSQEMAVTGWREALELAREKGPAPVLAQEYRVTPEMLTLRPEMAADGYKPGDAVRGAELHACYSRYMQRLATVQPDLVKELAKVGARFTHHTSIAPTGTIALSLANNASNGIEPTYGHRYFRNVIRAGRKTKERVEVVSFELLAYRQYVDHKATPESVPDYFTVADQVLPKAHIDMQAAAQKWVDSSISKTINVPTAMPYEDFKGIYLYAAEKGLKGCTTFRFNPEVFQGVLVKESDLKATVYEFTLEGGRTIRVRGDQEVVYDGATHSAANLFDALKEGVYGKL